MKKNSTRRKIAALMVCSLALFTVVLAEPGAADDPLITKSYVENQIIPTLKQYIDNRIGAMSGGTGDTVGTNRGETSMNVVELDAGSVLIGTAGTEMILRMGEAEIIATQKGGIVDATAGYDLGNKTPMPSNHLLIVPVSDGRGLTAKTKIIVIVRGGYTVK